MIMDFISVTSPQVFLDIVVDGVAASKPTHKGCPNAPDYIDDSPNAINYGSMQRLERRI